MFENLLNPIFKPLLSLGFFWAILIISFVLTFLITMVYKYTTDQELMKRLKKEMKEMQKELKKLSSNPQKAMSHQKKMMDKNMQYMKHSFKPTLYTFIPIIIIFGWLNAHMAYLPITPGSEFQISAEFKQGTFGEVSLEVIPDLEFLSTSVQTIENNAAFWTLKGGEGEYLMKFMFSNREFEKDLFITEENSYATPVKIIKDSDLVKILIHNKKVKPLENFGIGLSWIWTYIILSVIFSIILRKILKIS